MLTLLPTGLDIRRELSATIDSTTHSLCIMVYIFNDDDAGRSLLTELTRAAERGVRVRIIIDAFASLFTSEQFFKPLREAGGEVQRFNNRWTTLYLFRNHQKFVICDSKVALIGGFNIANEYFGDGVTSGWREIGLRVQDAAVSKLQTYFDRFWEANCRNPARLKDVLHIAIEERDIDDQLEWLVGAPGIRQSSYSGQLKRDLTRASQLSMLMAYFVPSASVRRMLARIARRGTVQIVLPYVTDVPIARYAAWYTYKRLLRQGCEIYEYQPRHLHAKLLVIDDILYVGSANIDYRSLHLNFELTLRIHNEELAAKARQLVRDTVVLSKPITQEVYDQNSSFMQRLVQRASYVFLSKLDFLLSRKFVE